MSSNSKICPQCQLTNAASNLVCLRCETPLIHQDFAPNWSEKYKDKQQDRNYFFEELFNPTLFVCLPLALFFAAAAAFTAGSSFMALFLLLAVLLAGVPFMPGDPVGDSLRRRSEQLTAASAPPQPKQIRRTAHLPEPDTEVRPAASETQAAGALEQAADKAAPGPQGLQSEG